MTGFNDEITAKYLSGNSAPEEEKALFDRVEAIEEAGKKFHHSKYAWEISGKVKHAEEFNVNEGWQKIVAKLEAKKKVVSWKKNHWLGIAAAITGIILTGFIIKANFSESQKESTIAIQKADLQASNKIISETKVIKILTTDSSKLVILPDSSRVLMNEHSILLYKTNYVAHREVELKGEAFFDVRHDASNPFFVFAGESTIKVLGTSFNVNTNKDQKAEVTVVTGRVKLSGQDKPEDNIMLVAGEKGVYDFQRRSLQKENGVEKGSWWKRTRLAKKLKNLFKKSNNTGH